MDFSFIQEFPEDLKTEWNGLVTKGVSHVPFLRYDYLKTWWQTRGGGEWTSEAQLVIILAKEEGHLVGIAPCFVSQHSDRKELLFLGCIEISDYLDFLVKPQHLGAFTEGLLAYIKSTLVPKFGIEAVDFYNLVDESPSIRALKSAAIAQGITCSVEPLMNSPYIPLTGDYEEYMANLDKKQRHEMKRKMRRILELPVETEWYIASDPTTIDREIQEFLRLMAYDESKRTFLTAAMREQMSLSMHEAFKAGILQLTFLTIGGEKAAAYLNFDFQNRIFVYNSGIDPRFYEHSPGWVLLIHLLKWANENDRFEFDFMRGNEDYKYKFGAVDRTVMRVRIDL